KGERGGGGVFFVWGCRRPRRGELPPGEGRPRGREGGMGGGGGERGAGRGAPAGRGPGRRRRGRGPPARGGGGGGGGSDAHPRGEKLDEVRGGRAGPQAKAHAGAHEVERARGGLAFVSVCVHGRNGSRPGVQPYPRCGRAARGWDGLVKCLATVKCLGAGY